MRQLLFRYVDDLEGRVKAVLDSGNVDDFRALATSRATAKEVLRAVDERVRQVHAEPEEIPAPPDPDLETRDWRDGATEWEIMEAESREKAFEAAAARVRDADRRDWA